MDRTFRTTVGPGRRRRCPPSHRVTINEDCNRTFPDLLRSQDECSHTWLNDKDYHRFRKSTEALVKTIVFGEIMSSKKDPDSYRNVLDRIYQSCCEMDDECSESSSLTWTKEEEAKLSRLFKQSDGCLRVGLEHWIAESIRQDAYKKRMDMLDLLQSQQQDSSSSLSSEDSFTDTSVASDVEEEVYKSSLSLSRPSRLFAHAVARAQLLANEETGTGKEQTTRQSVGL